MKELNQMKARAYDIISALESLQRELASINNAIGEKSIELQKLNEQHDRRGLDIID